MALSKLVDKLLGGGPGVDVQEYRCPDCGRTFESAKDPERAQCPECLANDVDVAGPSQ